MVSTGEHQWQEGYVVTLAYTGNSGDKDKDIQVYQNLFEGAMLYEEEGILKFQDEFTAQAETIDDAEGHTQELVDFVIGTCFALGERVLGKLCVTGAYTYKGEYVKGVGYVAKDIPSQITVVAESDYSKNKKILKGLSGSGRGVEARKKAIGFLKLQEHSLLIMYDIIELMVVSAPKRWASMENLRNEYPVLDDLCDYCNNPKRSGDAARHHKPKKVHRKNNKPLLLHPYKNVDEAWQDFRTYLIPWLCWEEMPKVSGTPQSNGTISTDESKQIDDQGATAQSMTDPRATQFIGAAQERDAVQGDTNQ